MSKVQSVISWVVLGLYWPMMFIATHTPVGRLPKIQIFGRDVTLHFSAFFILTFLFWLAKYGRQKPALLKRPVIFTLVVIAAYAAIDEISQSFVSRHCSIIDWLSDVAGAITALILLVLIRRWVYWLVVYWPTMFLLTHWPDPNTPFLRLPAIYQQFDICLVMLAYTVLTFIWWRSISRQPRFIINKKILISTLIVMPAYAIADEAINHLIGRHFNYSDFYSALAGIALAIACSAALAKHHVVSAKKDVGV